MKIYVITKGCYSDYHIVGVATDLKMAEKIEQYIDKEHNYYGNARIEEYSTEVWGEIVQNNKHLYLVSERLDGGLNAFRSTYDINEGYEMINKITFNNGRMNVYVFAKNEQHAIKIGRDMFAQHKAEKDGL